MKTNSVECTVFLKIILLEGLIMKNNNRFIIITLIIGWLIGALVLLSYFDSEKDRDKLVVGATYMTMNNDFYKAMNDELEKCLGEDAILITRDPSLDENKQIEQIRDFMKQSVDVIIINPVNSETIVEVLEEAKGLGIRIIAVDVPLAKDKVADCTIVSDNYLAGVQCALKMIKMNDKGRIVILEHNKVLSAIDRIKGFKDTIASHPEFQIVGELDCEGQTENALRVMNTFLNERNSIDIVMALNDPAALGALASLQEHYLTGKQIYSVDGSVTIKQLIHDKDYELATAAQSPLGIARKAAEVAKAMKIGESFDKEIVIETTLITKENIDEFNLSGWQ